jgi:hypothetical protein
MRSHHATCEYSWRRPPGRSRLLPRTLPTPQPVRETAQRAGQAGRSRRLPAGTWRPIRPPSTPKCATAQLARPAVLIPDEFAIRELSPAVPISTGRSLAQTTSRGRHNGHRVSRVRPRPRSLCFRTEVVLEPVTYQATTTPVNVRRSATQSDTAIPLACGNLIQPDGIRRGRCAW